MLYHCCVISVLLMEQMTLYFPDFFSYYVSTLQFDEDELYSNFKSFYKDVLDEFKSVGRVYQFKVSSIIDMLLIPPKGTYHFLCQARHSCRSSPIKLGFIPHCFLCL